MRRPLNSRSLAGSDSKQRAQQKVGGLGFKVNRDQGHMIVGLG